MKTWILPLSERIKIRESIFKSLTTGVNIYSCQKSGVSLEKEFLPGNVSDVSGRLNFVLSTEVNNPVIGLVNEEEVYWILGTDFAYPQSHVGPFVSFSIRGNAFLKE